MAGNITLRQYQIGGVYSGGNTPTPNIYLFPDGYKITPVTPLMKMYPLGDSVTAVISHHRCAHPDMPWECPIRVLGGTGYRWAEIESAPSGMTIGNGWFLNSYGSLSVGDDSLNLKWDNPVPGTYKIAVRVYDGLESVVFRFTLVVDAANFWFCAQGGKGAMTGTSYTNAATLAATYYGDTTVSPSRNKILVFCDGEYDELNTLSNGSPKRFYAGSGFHSINIINYPGETPVFRTRFEPKNSDNFLQGLEFEGMHLGNGGIIFIDPIIHRVVQHRLTFRNITDSGTADNQSMINHRGDNGLRQNQVTSQCQIIDSRRCLTESYCTDSHLIDRNTGFVNAQFTPLSGGGYPPSMIFPKADNRLVEISFNEYHAAGFDVGSVYYTHNNAGRELAMETLVFAHHNYSNIKSGTAISSNLSVYSGNVAVNHYARNTIIGGRVIAYATGEEGSGTVFSDNIIQNADGGIYAGSSDVPVGNYTSTNDLVGTSGLVDVNGNPVDSTKTGRVGHTILRGE